MAKFKEIIGTNIADFRKMLKDEDKETKLISARRARLIPTKKPDEMEITSVFMSAIRLVKEFRKMVSDYVGIKTAGDIHVFTEITFFEHDEKRVDGLICVVRGGKITDATLLEMKQGKTPLDEVQVLKYLSICQAYGIRRLVTISNQFVSHPTQSPLQLPAKATRKVDLYHMSWSLILTFANILLIDNDTNIEDADQREIMREVVDFFEHDNVGIKGFTTMKDSWKAVYDRVKKEQSFKKNDPEVIGAVESWLQEERDMALILSRKVGKLVDSGKRKHKNDLRGRIEEESQKFVDGNEFESSLTVNGAAAPIVISASMKEKKIRYSISLTPPLAADKLNITLQKNWIKKELVKMEKRNQDLFPEVAKKLQVAIRIKNSKSLENIDVSNLDEFAASNKGKLMSQYGYTLTLHIADKIGGTSNVIKLLESNLLSFYKTIVEHIEPWQRPAPKVLDSTLDGDDIA